MFLKHKYTPTCGKVPYCRIVCESSASFCVCVSVKVNASVWDAKGRDKAAELGNEEPRYYKPARQYWLGVTHPCEAIRLFAAAHKHPARSKMKKIPDTITHF